MKKYIITVPEDKRALFDEIVRENQFEVYEVSDKAKKPEGHEARHKIHEEDNIPWIEAQKLIDRNAT